MSVMTCVHGTAAEVNVMRVFFSGTDTLQEGYPLCFNFDAADVDSENNALTDIDVGVEFFNDARRIMVEKPAEGNKLHFAGVVSQKSAGVTGPGWIEIHRPGSICNVFAASNVDHGSTGLTTNTGETVTFQPGSYNFITGGFLGSGTAVILQDVDRSSTSGLVMAELCTGEPSGGVNVVSSLSVSGVWSLALGVPAVNAGVYLFSQQTLAAAPITSVFLGTGDGNYHGQRIKLVADSTFASTAISVNISTAWKSEVLSTATGIVSGIVGISAAGESVELCWNGTYWGLVSSIEVSGIQT